MHASISILTTAVNEGPVHPRQRGPAATHQRAEAIVTTRKRALVAKLAESTLQDREGRREKQIEAQIADPCLVETHNDR
jgi:hypothetical protein